MTGKKIAVVTPTFLPYRGGMCVVAEQDARQLAALGHEVDVLVPGRTGGETGGYAVKPLRPWIKYGNAAFVPGAFGAVHDYDLVVLHYPFFGGAEPVALAKWLGRCQKLAIYYHMDTVGVGLVGAFFRLHGAIIRPNILRLADRILVTSFDYIKSSKLNQRFLNEPELFRELPPAVDTERFAPGTAPVELVARYKLDSSLSTVVFVGGLDRAHYFKGVNFLIDALAVSGMEKIQAVIVGGGELIAELRLRAESKGVAKRVFFTGPVSDDELPLHYRLGQVFAFPSVDRSEAFGIAALEAMSSGVPVVASNLPGVRTIVRPNETGFLIKPKSVSALAARILDVVNDKRKHDELSAAGRNMSLDEYSEKRRIEKWDRIANELLDTP
ncbi:MAG: glycosyltransferase family 4 protein [Patescibacteria group bacterium]